MRLLHFKQNDKLKIGVQTSEGVLDVEKAAKELNVVIPSSMQGLIEAGEEGKQTVESIIEKAKGNTALFLNEENVTYGPAAGSPEKIICVGLNYMPHIEESKMEIPTTPVLFSKFNNALAGHQQDVALPDVDRKSTRLNSSHVSISYAVFCLKKKR